MQHPATTINPLWPTLQGRLSIPLTSRVEAVRQLQITMPLTKLAQSVLLKNKKGSSNGQPSTAG